MNRAMAVGALIPVVLLAGCVSDGPVQKVRPIGPQPAGAAPSQLVVNMKDFVDTDGNGYLDSGIATVYVFSAGYALPLDIAGSFDFRLTDPGGAVLAEWAITPDQARPCRIKTQVGPGYGFTLDLRRVGAEKSDQSGATLEGVFTDASGRTVRSGRLAVTIGRSR